MGHINAVEAYNKFAKYYDAYVNDFKEDIELYCKFCKQNDNILEVGCGTGRVLKRLLEKGLKNITGVDISDEMLKLARTKLDKYLNNKRLTLETHDFSIEPLRKSFNKVFITYYTFNYILDKPEKFLRNIYSSMADNSLIVIDLFYPLLFLDPESDGVWIERELKYGANKTITLRSKKTFDGTFERRILVFAEGDTTTTIESERRFYSKTEIEELLHKTGFRNVRVIYGYSFGDTRKFDDDYPLRGYNIFNVDLKEYANREEAKPNFISYAFKPL
jgi:ubiquinone/menaquinone biosynthesis C-methylase UbiE